MNTNVYFFVITVVVGVLLVTVYKLFYMISLLEGKVEIHQATIEEMFDDIQAMKDKQKEIRK